MKVHFWESDFIKFGSLTQEDISCHPMYSLCQPQSLRSCHEHFNFSPISSSPSTQVHEMMALFCFLKVRCGVEMTVVLEEQ